MLNKIILECLINYCNYGKRSNQRIENLHQYIGKYIDNPEFEKQLNGLFNKKKVDIFDAKTNTAYEIKLILSNYKQNSNNYFENMLGTTINLKAKSYNVCQIIFLSYYMPYFDKSGILKKIEFITEENINKYINLMSIPNNYLPTDLIFTMFDTGNLEYLQNNIGKLINFEDLKTTYNISIPTYWNNFNNTINNFLHHYSFQQKFKG